MPLYLTSADRYRGCFLNQGAEMFEKDFENETFENLTFTYEKFEDCRFSDCTFKDCLFEEAELSQCIFSDCTFINCTVTKLKASLHSELKQCRFIGCRLTSINWSEVMPSEGFSDPIEALQDCCLKYNTFTEINFRKFDFSGNEITESIFAECMLSESRFKDCRLDRTEFYRCDMQKADFRKASGYQVDIISCKMKNAVFSFPEAVELLGSIGVKVEY